jgi:hypothetical protein
MYQKPRVDRLGTVRELTRQKDLGFEDGFTLNNQSIGERPDPGRS